MTAGSLRTRRRPLLLVNAEVSDYAIRVMPKAPPAERFAALQLQAYLLQATGCKLAIVASSRAAPARRFLCVGPGPWTRASTEYRALKGMASSPEFDGFAIDVVGQGDVVLAGTRPRGTLFAVYAFLEDYAGVRFLTPGESGELVPKRPTLKVPFVHRLEAPSFEERVGFPAMEPAEIVTQIDWLAKNRSNRIWICIQSPSYLELWRRNRRAVTAAAAVRDLSLECGGHATHAFLSADRYYARHPEWYPMQSGMRLPSQDTFCYSNRDAVAECGMNVAAFLRENPCFDTVSLWHADSLSFCQCPACGSLSKRVDVYTRFINSIRETIARERISARVQQIAYNVNADAYQNLMLRLPSREVPRADSVLFAHHGQCYESPLETSHARMDAGARSLLGKWVRLAHSRGAKVSVYTYYGFYQALYRYPLSPMWHRVVARDLEYFRRVGVDGVWTIPYHHSGRSWDWGVLPTYYVSCRFAWNTRQDVRRVMDDYCRGLCGEAASLVARILAAAERELTPLTGYYEDFGAIRTEAEWPMRRADVWGRNGVYWHHEPAWSVPEERRMSCARKAEAGCRELARRLDPAIRKVRVPDPGQRERFAGAVAFLHYCRGKTECLRLQFEAQKAVKQGDWSVAVPKLRRALALDRSLDGYHGDEFREWLNAYSDPDTRKALTPALPRG